MLASHQAGKDTQKIKDAWAVAYETGYRTLNRTFMPRCTWTGRTLAIFGEWHEYLSGVADQWMRAAEQ